MKKKVNRRDFLGTLKSAGLISLFPLGTPIYLSNPPGLIRGDSLSQKDPDGPDWPENVQEFPSLALDKEDNPWIAVLERDLTGKKIKVFCHRDDEINEVTVIKPVGITGISPPSICFMKDSLILAFAIERNNRWDIAYSIIEDGVTKKDQGYNIIASANNVNIDPVITASEDRAHILWESSEDGNRVIYTCQLSKGGNTSPIILTDSQVNSYNPTVATLPDGNLFAAWDSVRNNQADIYGSRCMNGKWQPEVRLTFDNRIERHPYVTNRGNEIWMCWEAQSYQENHSNNITEQRIVVAQLKDGSLYAPKGLFESVSPDIHQDSELSQRSDGVAYYQKIAEKKYNLVRPRIAFDHNGSLWLSAREFKRPRQYESKPVIWNYNLDSWSDKKLLMDQQGKRQPIQIVFGRNRGFASYQYDDLPLGSGPFMGLDVSWKSGFGVTELSAVKKETELITEPLKMPFTDFSLQEKMRSSNADLPRQRITHQGEDLKLFFGDLHNHTDFSACRRAWNQTAKDDFNTCRDIDRLDFCALTDHAEHLDATLWDFLKEQVRHNQDDGHFITFIGQEWTPDATLPDLPAERRTYGHHNLIFLDPHFPRFYDAQEGDADPQMLWDQLQKDGADFICIPHQLADVKTTVDWGYVNEQLQPLAEIFQGRESYEYPGCPRQAYRSVNYRGNYMHDAWEKGIITGVIASPDHWGGIGKAAVWAKDLSRESLFEALRARHTYGTTGGKIMLLFRTRQALMGDKLLQSSHPDHTFQIKAVAGTNIKEVAIFRNNKIVYSESPNEKEINLEWEDSAPLNQFAWYYTRIHCTDNEIAWSSPIWFIDK